MAALKPEQYAPCVEYRDGHGGTYNAPRANVGSPRPKTPPKPFDWNKAKKFDYTDENGQLLYQVGRMDYPDGTKAIRQRRPDGNGGWINNVDSVRRVPYHLPDVLEAEEIYHVEGEGVADLINDLLKATGQYGWAVATTGAQGAMNVDKTDWAACYGKQNAFLGDNDEPGRKRVEYLLATLSPHGPCRDVVLPDLPPKGDFKDWHEAGGTLDEFFNIVDDTPFYVPPEPERRFKFHTLAQLKKRPKQPWLIHGFLKVGDVSLITAKHASFKSFITLDMGLSIACDIPFQGYEVKAGLVIYVAAEGAAGLVKRAEAWCSHHQVEPSENFIVLGDPVQIHLPEVRAAFVAEITELKPVLIIFDTVARCAVGLEENSSKDMGVWFDALDAVAKETGAHVLAVHHNNKNGDFRGSTAIPAAVNTHISLERNVDSVTLKFEKQKDEEELNPIIFEKKVINIPGSYGEESSLVFLKLEARGGTQYTVSAQEQKFLDVLEEIGPSPSTRWEKSCGVETRTFYRGRKRLIKLGAVIPSKEANGSGAYPTGTTFSVNPSWGKDTPDSEGGEED